MPSTIRNISCLALFALFSCQQVITKEDAAKFASDYYQAKYKQLEKGATNFAKAPDNAFIEETLWQDFQKQGTAFLSGMETIGLHLTQTSCSVTIDSLVANKSEATFIAREELQILYTVNGDNSVDTIVASYLSVYEVTIERKKGSFLIKEESLLSENPLSIGKEQTIGTINFAVYGASTQDTTSKLRQNIPYDRNRTVRYALMHWNNPNTAFCNFTTGGGDCTNFGSQCLNDGGWLMSDTWLAKGEGCCDNLYACSIQNCYTCSWTVAHEFYLWLPKSGRVVPQSFQLKDLDIGDVIQQDIETDGHIDHTMIVTDKSNGIPFVTFRSVTNPHGVEGARMNMPTNQIKGTLYCWKLSNSY